MMRMIDLPVACIDNSWLSCWHHECMHEAQMGQMMDREQLWLSFGNGIGVGQHRCVKMLCFCAHVLVQ